MASETITIKNSGSQNNVVNVSSNVANSNVTFINPGQSANVTVSTNSEIIIKIA